MGTRRAGSSGKARDPRRAPGEQWATLFELCTRLTMKRGLEMSRQAISQHLDVLESASLVITKRDGRYKFHYLDTSPLRAILERQAV